MKQLAVLSFFLFCAISLSAQNKESLSIQSAIDACVALRNAVVSKDPAAIRQSAKTLHAVGASSFTTLRCTDEDYASLNGHLVFDEAFANGLAEGQDVYQKADYINKNIIHRGQTFDGSILTKTCFVKAGKSSKYTFASKGHQELAVVAEAGGLVTMKIHVTNSAGFDKRFDDTKSVKRGMAQRKTSFELPTDRMNTVELEIVNCGKKDCSFVVISN